MRVYRRTDELIYGADLLRSWPRGKSAGMSDPILKFCFRKITAFIGIASHYIMTCTTTPTIALIIRRKRDR